MYRIIHFVAISSCALAAAAAAILPQDNNNDGCPALTNPAPLAQRDLATITSAFSSVSSGISDLDTAVRALTSPNDLPALQAASSRLLEAINSGTSTITSNTSGGGSLSLPDAIKLQQEVITSLENKGEQLATSLADKKPTIQRLGLCEIFATQAGEIADGSKKLSDAVVAQVPEQARQIAQGMAAGFTDTLDKTRALFAKGSCVNGGSVAGNDSVSENGRGNGNGTVVTAAAAARFTMQRGYVGGLFGLVMAGFVMAL